jgi:hypothetical protein
MKELDILDILHEESREITLTILQFLPDEFK